MICTRTGRRTPSLDTRLVLLSLLLPLLLLLLRWKQSQTLLYIYIYINEGRRLPPPSTCFLIKVTMSQLERARVCILLWTEERGTEPLHAHSLTQSNGGKLDEHSNENEHRRDSSLHRERVDRVERLLAEHITDEDRYHERERDFMEEMECMNMSLPLHLSIVLLFKCNDWGLANARPAQICALA